MVIRQTLDHMFHRKADFDHFEHYFRLYRELGVEHVVFFASVRACLHFSGGFEVWTETVYHYETFVFILFAPFLDYFGALI